MDQLGADVEPRFQLPPGHLLFRLQRLHLGQPWSQRIDRLGRFDHPGQAQEGGDAGGAVQLGVAPVSFIHSTVSGSKTSNGGAKEMRLMKFGFATLAATLLASGCAERAPRSFVQPNVIKKSDLAGTWYYLQTVTDAPPTSASAFIGLS